MHCVISDAQGVPVVVAHGSNDEDATLVNQSHLSDVKRAPDWSGELAKLKSKPYQLPSYWNLTRTTLAVCSNTRSGNSHQNIQNIKRLKICFTRMMYWIVLRSIPRPVTTLKSSLPRARRICASCDLNSSSCRTFEHFDLRCCPHWKPLGIFRLFQVISSQIFVLKNFVRQ